MLVLQSKDLQVRTLKEYPGRMRKAGAAAFCSGGMGGGADVETTMESAQDPEPHDCRRANAATEAAGLCCSEGESEKRSR